MALQRIDLGARVDRKVVIAKLGATFPLARLNDIMRYEKIGEMCNNVYLVPQNQLLE